MTDPFTGERSLTSDCGTVTVTIAVGAAPRIRLAPSAERMFTRDLAELVTATAHEAIAAAREDALEADAGPGIGDAVETLARFRDDLRERGYGAVIGERRKAAADERDGADARGTSESDADGTGPERPQAVIGGMKLGLPPSALGALDSTIALLQRFQETPPGTGKGEEPGPVGRAKSESKLVAVESTNELPISTVWLSKRSLEIGAKGLSIELTETARAAFADLAAKQGAYFTGLGVPITPEKAADAAEASGPLRDAAVAFAGEIRSEQDRITQMFKDGGHFA